LNFILSPSSLLVLPSFCRLNNAIIYQSFIFYLSLDLISFADSDLYAMIAGGAASVAAKGEVAGDVLTIGAFAAAANSKVYGNVDAIGAVSLGANAMCHGNILAKGAFTAGANSEIVGDIDSDAAVTISAHASVTGVIISSSATTIAPSAVMEPPLPYSSTHMRLPSLQGPLIFDTLQSRYISLMDLPYSDLISSISLSTSTTPYTLLPGVYRHPAAWSFGAGEKLYFPDGSASDTWIIQIIGAASFVGEMTLGTNIDASNIVWYVEI
jgi:cytoskeletal protein CcmA (bactofilin family)